MRISGVTWSSTVAGISVLSALPPHTSLAPLRQRIVDQRVAMLHRVHADHAAQHHRLGLARVAQRQATGLGRRTCCTNSSATFWSTMMRSVLMQICPLLANAPKAAAFTASSMSASSRITSGALPPSSSTTGFRYFAQVMRDDAPDLRRAGEVDAPHRRVRDHRLDHRAGVGRRVGDVVDDARRKARFLEALR